MVGVQGTDRALQLQLGRWGGRTFAKELNLFHTLPTITFYLQEAVMLAIVLEKLSNFSNGMVLHLFPLAAVGL